MPSLDSYSPAQVPEARPARELAIAVIIVISHYRWEAPLPSWRGSVLASV